VSVNVLSSNPGTAYDTAVIPASSVSRATITLTFYDSDLAPHYNLAVPIASASIPVARSVAPLKVRPPSPSLPSNNFSDGASPTQAAPKKSSTKVRSQSVSAHAVRQQAPHESSSELSARVLKRGADGLDLAEKPCVPAKISKKKVAVLKRPSSPVLEAEVKRVRTDLPVLVLTPSRLTPLVVSSSDPVPRKQSHDIPAPSSFEIPSDDSQEIPSDVSGDPSSAPRLVAPAVSPEVVAEASSHIGPEDSELPAPDPDAAASPPGSEVPSPGLGTNSSKGESASLKLGLRKAKFAEKVKQNGESCNSSGSLRTTKAESWAGMTPRTFEEMTCTVRAGGSILRDVTNSDSVAVNWAEHSSFYRKIFACSMTDVVRIRMSIRDLALVTGSLQSIPDLKLDNIVNLCVGPEQLELSLAHSSLSLLDIDSLYTAICRFRKTQAALVRLGSLKWGTMQASNVRTELDGTVMPSLLQSVTPTGTGSGDKSRMIAVCNADPECPFHCHYNFHILANQWVHQEDRYVPHNCLYDTTFLGSVLLAQAHKTKRAVRLKQLKKLQALSATQLNNPNLVTKIQGVRLLIDELDEQQSLNPTVSPMMMSIMHHSPYLSVHLAPTLKSFFPKPGAPPPAESVVRAHIAKYTSYPVSKAFVQSVRTCSIQFFERPGKDDVSHLSNMIQAIRNCGHVASINTVTDEQAWDLLVEAHQSQVKHATPEGRDIKTITREDVEKPEPGIYVVSVSWGPKQSQRFELLPGSRESYCPSTITHDGAHMRNRHCPGTLMSSDASIAIGTFKWSQ
jgi:hypothetical protein